MKKYFQISHAQNYDVESDIKCYGEFIRIFAHDQVLLRLKKMILHKLFILVRSRS